VKPGVVPTELRRARIAVSAYLPAALMVLAAPALNWRGTRRTATGSC
jgi:hypothetical protein